MISHLTFPYTWVECTVPSECDHSAHLTGDPETIKSQPLEWIVALLGCRQLGEHGIAWRDEENELHNDDGPALETSAQIQWWSHGKLHRVDGPAVIQWDGSLQWWSHGQQHREDGPAVVSTNRGEEEWWFEGYPHRSDGPAVEKANGQKEWFVNGKRHRDDGPAIERPSGKKQWYFHGQPLSEKSHAARMRENR